MSITATVESDTIRLPEGLHIPDGTQVVIETSEHSARSEDDSLSRCLLKFAGIADDLPSDLARRMCGLAERLGDSSTFMTSEELHSLRSDRTSA
jgi:hypothetical protein